MSATMRVRQVLSTLDSQSRAALKKLLPPKLAMPDAETQRYPAALLAAFPKAESYSLLGLVAEEMLRFPVAEITLDNLIVSTLKWCPTAPTDKIRASTTTAPFLAALQATRTALDEYLVGIPRVDQVVRHDPVEGHPDMRTRTQIIEIKLTGLLKQHWVDFLFQVFAYAALCPEATSVALVLPLQRTVWSHDLAGWATRDAFRDALCAAATKALSFSAEGALTALLLQEEHLIGCHAPKLKSLVDTVRALPDARKPYQIFLGGPQTSKLAIADAELAAAASVVAERRQRLYVHSQYIINLCNTKDSWHTDLLAKNVQYAAAIGCRGVVVHVGKSVGAAVPEAVAVMRAALQKVMEHATPACPVLLETPAGQGTETLTEVDDFLGFVESFGDPRLRACLDTCHVFACGHTPADYIGKFTAKPGLLQLIHYNDSAAPCGSCVDRHAYMGTGHIGLEGMRKIAELCTAHKLPMLIE